MRLETLPLVLARHGICSAIEGDQMLLEEALLWGVRISKEIELAEKARSG